MPTSPENAEIEAVFGEGTRDEIERARPTSLRSEWRRVGGFIRRPTLPPAPGEGVDLSAAPARIARVFALDVSIMFVLIMIAVVVVALGVDLPETALAGIEITPAIVFAVVVVAPVFEEIVFRGWLSGRPGHVLALLALAFAAGAISMFGPQRPLLSVAFGLIGMLGALAAIVFLWSRPAMGWFARGFPLFFWLSTLAFALIHLGNFDPEDTGGSLAMLLPLVIPQFVLGSLLGYLRVEIGLWAAILLHAMHNATALSLAALAMSAG